MVDLEKIPKPRKKRVTKPKTDNTVNYQKDIKMLLSVVTGLVAAQTSPLWLISEDELDMVSAPLSNIIARLDIASIYGEYIDYISLVTALGIILTPRIIEQKRRSNERKNNQHAKKSDNTITDDGTQPPNNVPTDGM